MTYTLFCFKIRLPVIAYLREFGGKNLPWTEGTGSMGVVDEVKERIDIVDLISQYVPLKKAGRNFKALCPFHTEKTPSFYVFPHTQTWHCFGCNAGGDVFSFIMKKENMDFREALRFLAAKAGVELEKKPPEEIERVKVLREVLSVAADYYHRLLTDPEKGAKARAYLEKRGIRPETAEVFRLGYALDEWHNLEKYMTGLGYKREILLEAGLLIQREDGSGVYDRFRGRLIIPIRDEQGRVVGFGARTLDPEGAPKYINSPATPLFDKGRLLFGLDMAKESIRTQDMAIIVEGYMDVIQAHQMGFRNVVASMGTALTETQLRKLARYTRRFALALDPDVAGSEATIRALQLAEEALDKEAEPFIDPRGMLRFEERLKAEFFIISLPSGYDPDALIRESPERWEERVENALPMVDFYINVITQKFDLNSPRGKAEAVRTVIPIIQGIPGEIERDHYIHKLARLVKVDEMAIRREMLSLRRRKSRPRAKPTPSKEKAPAFGLEEYVLAQVLQHPHLLELVEDQMRALAIPPLDEADFAEVENRVLFGAWKASLDKGISQLEAFVDTLDPLLQERVHFIMEKARNSPPVPLEKLEQEVLNCALRLRGINLHRYLQEIRFLQEEAQERGDQEGVAHYLDLVKSQVEELATVHRALAQCSGEKARAV